MRTAQTAFSSLEKKRFVCAKPAKAPPLLPGSCSTPTSWQGLPPCPRHSVMAFILCDCSCPGNNIAQALGTSTSHSQAAFRDICQGGVCQASLILARAGSQQDCVGCKSWSSVLSLVCLPPPPFPSPFFPLAFKHSTRLHWYLAGVLA